MVGICLDLTFSNAGHVHSYWSVLLVQDIYFFDIFAGKSKRNPLLPHSQCRNRIILYADLLHQKVICETPFFTQFELQEAYPQNHLEFHCLLPKGFPDGTRRLKNYL
jgi:hypothetical protein